MKDGAYTVCKYFKSMLLQCDTVSSNTRNSNLSPKEAWVMAASENGISNHDDIGCMSEDKANLNLLTCCNDRRALVGTLAIKNIKTQFVLQ